ncbi:transposase [Streptomyces desertarenae]|uniref:Transposase n=1 Tax=Streptomyces desertarenae TaxID=2666184 RepID=A0ABW4PTP6_9ACTN
MPGGTKSNRSRRYTEEFERDAIALVHSSGKTVAGVARELGVSAGGLRKRARRDRADRGQGASGEPTTAEREELRRLRKLTRERAEAIGVPRKAAVFFREGERSVSAVYAFVEAEKTTRNVALLCRSVPYRPAACP